LNGSSRWVAALLAAIATFVALLTAFSLLARRWVVRPLAALSGAVDAIAGGSTFARRRPSRVREIDELEAGLAAMDESLRAAAERDLRREEERRFLVSSIAHDLRTPLFLLRGHVDALARGVGDAHSNVRRAEASGLLLDRLVGDLFAFSTSSTAAPSPPRTKSTSRISFGRRPSASARAPRRRPSRSRRTVPTSRRSPTSSS